MSCSDAVPRLSGACVCPRFARVSWRANLGYCAAFGKLSVNVDLVHDLLHIRNLRG